MPADEAEADESALEKLGLDPSSFRRDLNTFSNFCVTFSVMCPMGTITSMHGPTLFYSLLPLAACAFGRALETCLQSPRDQLPCVREG